MANKNTHSFVNQMFRRQRVENDGVLFRIDIKDDSDLNK